MLRYSGGDRLSYPIQHIMIIADNDKFVDEITLDRKKKTSLIQVTEGRAE